MASAGERGPLPGLARGLQALGRRLPRPGRLTTLRAFGPFLIGFAIVGMLAFVQMSSTPTFCGSCHLMKKYYRSWKASRHNQIACVECHISPGITAEVRKKYEALAMVAKYFTATYGTKPWAEVEDAACLRCHQRRLLEGEVDFHGVNFDHRPHLTESRRGLRLRCTSCHTQVMVSEHLTVTVSTCALCHFKDQPANAGLGACLNCHKIPDRVMSPTGVSFDHSQVRTLGMACGSCHSDVVRGDGAVPRERCLTCHNEPDRLARYGDKLFLHEMHVSTHKVDCRECHLTIEHGLPSRAAAAHQGPAAGACEACHGSGHSPQQALYAGVGGRGVPSLPSPMYLSGVACQGCHNPEFSNAVAVSEPSGPRSAPAGAIACMSCHGPTYKRIFEAWEQGVNERTAALRRQLEGSLGAMGVDPPQAWQDAQHNFTLVSRGRGVHNINYSYIVLDRAFDQLNDARRTRGLPALSRPWTSMPASPCLGCHLGIENQTGTFAGRTYSHGPHVLAARLDCERCHRKHAERPKIEIVRYGPDGCTSCHHQNLAASSFGTCARCHGDVKQATFPSYRGEFSHRQHLQIGEECAGCHVLASGDPRPSRARCAECHD